ncbi:kinesin-like protein [Aspergillus sclerotialis]|uniref:Kinesin-like protein n=1 Tax=Aspergillus sclerotialis TaxID=2070753 RepID=A0A3A2ZAM5_9EURO|nr:kinesin-like protein [Aspergillus sclerotialis]
MDDINTAIYVTVRCRSRNEREAEEDRAVILRTDGVKGKTVEVSIASLPSKNHSFDRVFSSSADQRMVYEDTVLPMVGEMLLAYNCTAFAYGQTGTGKTYTMSGDMAEEFGLLADNAGIIPRALYTIFEKLKEADSSVKCSFIEIYNEELRDLLSDDSGTKLQLFENERKGANGSILVKGIEETYIRSPSAGIKLLEMGSLKRQVAATNCNDLSSRSHTIFTINVLTKTSEGCVISGKLNLVDLAGGENIQRSGAENKRAVEAGQINKRLLTLGRVMNALVDKASHVPYRESKLTRLLQDSLGGRTKTCIIATISPCQSSLEETLSTLDYAFRAKNIYNKPQVNAPVRQDKLLSELATEIEKLKGNLSATRQRNGVYMTPETYEEMMRENDSLRNINREQNEKIQVLESGLQRKGEELLALTGQLRRLEHDNRETHSELSRVNDVLNKVQSACQCSVTEVSDIAEKVERQIKSFQTQQTKLFQDFSANVNSFLENEMVVVQKNQSLLHDTLRNFERVEESSRTGLLNDDRKEAFNELRHFSNQVRMATRESVNELSQAIPRISERLQDGLLICHNQFALAHNALDKDVQSIIEMMLKHVEEQNIEISKLQLQLRDANSRMVDMNYKTSLDVAQLLEEERASAETDRQKFLSQIGALYDSSFQQR